jgi:hypothetical protein
MPFTCSICDAESTRICERCTKDACDNHICEKCRRCSDCCECEVRLDEPAYENARPAAHTPAQEPEPDPEPPTQPETEPVPGPEAPELK